MLRCDIKPYDTELLIDLCNISIKYTGTTEYAINITKCMIHQIPSAYILIDKKIAKFWKLDEYTNNIITPNYLVKNKIVFDMIFTPYQYFSYWHLYLVKKHSKRNVFTLQDILIIKHDYKSSLSNLFKLSIKLSTGVVFISNYVKNDVMSWFDLNNIVNSRIIYHGIKHFYVPYPESLTFS